VQKKKPGSSSGQKESVKSKKWGLEVGQEVVAETRVKEKEKQGKKATGPLGRGGGPGTVEESKPCADQGISLKTALCNGGDSAMVQGGH